VSILFGGVETGGTWTVCALGSEPGHIVAHERFRTTCPDETLGRIIEFFRRGEKPAAIGVGSFGPVDLDPNSPHWGEVTSTPKPGWAGTPVAAVLGRELQVPISFDTDVAAAAVGEYCWGAGRGAESLCYLTVGTGIGAGLVLGDRPWHGLVHPEPGHMRVPHDRTADPFAGVCPLHGDCWEGLASGLAMAERWGKPAEELAPEQPGWELEAHYLALGILNIVYVVSPDRLIAGGGVFDHPGLRERVRDHLEALNRGYVITPVLVAPELGDDAGVLGAIAMVKMPFTARAALPGT
jgi:fructokinase